MRQVSSRASDVATTEALLARPRASGSIQGATVPAARASGVTSPPTSMSGPQADTGPPGSSSPTSRPWRPCPRPRHLQGHPRGLETRGPRLSRHDHRAAGTLTRRRRTQRKRLTVAQLRYDRGSWTLHWPTAMAAGRATRTWTPCLVWTTCWPRSIATPPAPLGQALRQDIQRLGCASAAAAQRMLLRHLHDAAAHPIRVRDPHLQQPPRLPPGLPQDLHATLAELPPHPGQLAHLQPQRHARGWRRGSAARQLQKPATQEEDRAPLGSAAEFAVDGQPQRVAIEDPAALRVGWVQQHAAAQHVHGAMIAQQTPSGAQMPAPGRWSKRTRTVMQVSALIRSSGVLQDSDTNLTSSTAGVSRPEREDDQRLCWSSAWWSPPPESNRRPHPYHGTTGNRCADRCFPR